MTGSTGSIRGTPDDDLTTFVQGLTEKAQLETKERAAELTAIQQDNLQEQETEEKNPLAAAFKKFSNKIKPHSTTVKKAKEAKAAQRKLIPVDKLDSSAKEFARKNPQFIPARLLDLADKISKGLPKEDILKFIKSEYPDPMDASLALAFLSAVIVEDQDKIDVQSIQKVLNQEIIDKPKEDRAKKLDEEEKTIATKEATETALKQLEGGNFNKYLEHLLAYPGEAPSIGINIYGAYRENTEKALLNLLSRLGRKIDKLKDITSKEDSAEIRNLLPLVRKLQSVINLIRFFKVRNRPSKLDGAAKQKDRKAAKAA